MSTTRDYEVEEVRPEPPPPTWWDRVEQGLRRFAPPALRVVIGLVFVWFGLLKVVDRSPVAELLSATLPFVPQGLLLPALGSVEVLLGAALVIGRFRRITLVVTGGHLAGTFLVFVTAPSLAWSDGNPLLLTADGEFVLKNLVLLCAVLMLLGHRRPDGR
ncbi:DoxX family protein [Saccharothrix australiensis]|uniref:Putative membrane protein YphA (DoxX/SURF4 family) n=1 Tax=Saccharothrix australiensis TaxID=2072 RepID=A0A495VY06_9PSEU|nr:DoxX family protein [Saccharothrix australiensis]RKT54311.1 putative membrane protein YphA (DoxX/SURF4 family) [Saccharothrix australiensis]